ncbi:single-stranded-DNA-specific exonuclease RecJ [Acidicapsa ligni]|uniref:single-stranded-DNA-specific exonuclease RecJ n=1 Tax=Acidicapsa ligni TaxID=542300 RepID=UPI0021E0186F|nr:single-stranded-DNA-specific exonuclease RecJ [Acidicapsa ligni]
MSTGLPVVTATLPTLHQRWQLTLPHPEEAAALAASAHIPTVIAELLITRGIHTAEDAARFLNPDINQLHDPLRMLGMDVAVARLQKAIVSRETILLYGDYDVDGTTAVVLLKTAIEMMAGADGCQVRFHVPHRLREGYGLQSSVLEQASAEGVSLVITVDTGMRAFTEAETARRLGLDLIITDHHLPDAGDAIPKALAILNPNQPGCEYPEKSLCGAAIAFKLAQALLERWDAARTHSKIVPSFLKMVALATVADAVPLRGENRVLAALGIRELSRPAGAGLRALFRAAGLDPTTKALTSFDLGFRLAPRINAAGRMDVAAEVVELFTTRDLGRAQTLAEKLERLNTERRETEAEALKNIEFRLAAEARLADCRMLVMAGDGWHRGVIGILASRVVDRTAKPAIVVSIEDGVAYGSGRSIDGFPLLEAIETCADLYTRFGGHAFAVGFAMPAENLPEMERRLLIFAAEKLAGQNAEHVLRIHAELPLDRVTPVLGGWLHKLEPLGHGNAEPVFLARNVRLAGSVRLMKERHIRLMLTQAALAQGSPTHNSSSGASIQAVGWNLARRAEELSLQAGSLIHLAYRIRENDHPQYGGLQIEIAGMQLTEEP